MSEKKTDIVIRSAEPEDAAELAALLGLPGVYEGLLQTPHTPNASRIEYHQKVEPRECRLVAVSDGKIVGMAGLHIMGTTLRRSHARTLGLFVIPEMQGRGIGRKLLASVIDWADKWGHVLRIELHVHADNERAHALYKSMGFIDEGRHKGFALRGGQYIDSVSMARLHPNPPRISP
ncbi:MAG TPA: GNAT family N-acetyltransferase [Ramlibacter sp.]|nr:GNAT family N-acetyltransferase [Ramlibacter sp.]